MMKALTEFLAAGLKTEQPKATLQGGDSGTQPFAETMDALLASTTGGSQKLTSINELTDSALDGIKVSADSQLPSQMANLTAGSDAKTPTGNLAEQPRHLIEAESKHQLMGDFTMDITKPGQDAPKAVQDAGTSSTDPVGIVAALTEFLAAGLKTEQPKATLQGGDSGTHPFAETMDALLASTTGGSQKLTSINELTDSALDGIKVSADSQLPSQMANLTAGSDAKTPTGNLAEQPRHLIEAESKHQLMGDFTMDITKPGQDAPKAVQDAGTSSTDPVGIVAALTELNVKGNSPDNFQAAMNDLTSASIPSQVIVTNDLIDSQGVVASTVIGDGSLDSPIGVAATYVETSAGAEESAELTMAASSTSVPTTPVQSELPNKAMSAAIPTEITLNMVEAGRKFAGHLSETPSNAVTVTSTTASNASAYTAGVATRDVVGVDNSLARTEGAFRGAEFPGVAERLPLSQAADRPSVDPRLEVATDRAAVASSAAVVRTELTARQPVSFDTGIKLSNTEPQQFAGDMATHVRVLKSQSRGEVKLNLHPAELGRMSISVSTEGNETRVAFVVETSQARQAVEAALPRLRDMLENAGLSLSDSDVSEQRDPQADAGEKGPGGSRGEATSTDSGDDSVTTVLSLTVDPDRLVDTYI